MHTTRRGIKIPDSTDHTRLYDLWQEIGDSHESAFTKGLREATQNRYGVMIAGADPTPTSLPVVQYGTVIGTTNVFGQIAVPFARPFVGLSSVVFTSGDEAAFHGSIAISAPLGLNQVIARLFINESTARANALVRVQYAAWGHIEEPTTPL